MSQPHLILGLSKTASLLEIKKKYRDLARKFHPDKYSGDKNYANQQFALIDDAYRKMISPEYQKNKNLNYQRGVFYPPKQNRKPVNPNYSRTVNLAKNYRPAPRGPQVLCNGTVLMSGGCHPSQLSYETLQNLRRNMK